MERNKRRRTDESRGAGKGPHRRTSRGREEQARKPYADNTDGPQDSKEESSLDHRSKDSRVKGRTHRETKDERAIRFAEKKKSFQKGGDRPKYSGSSERYQGAKKPYAKDADREDRKDGYDKKYSSPKKYSGDDRKPAYKGKGNKKDTAAPVSDEIRLNKYIANSGVCSRREADELIRAGSVSVNGQVVTEMGFKVKRNDEVKFNNERVKPEKKVYLLLNKPKDYVTTLDDPHAKKTVHDLIKHACPERIYPVGRLDRNTTGVLLFTNDGDLAKKLTHPKFKKKKIYHAFLNRNVTKNDLAKIASGVQLDDIFIQPDAVDYADPEDKTQIGIELHSGQNRVVRRIFEALDYKVVKLDRVYFAGLTKKNVPRGKFRFLTEKELNLLRMNAFS